MRASNTSERLKFLMENRNLRQVDILNLAKKYSDIYNIKLTKSDLSQYINGKVEPGSSKLSILGKALNVSEAWLIGYDVSMKRENDDNKYENIKAYDEDDRPYVLDDETLALIDSLRTRPEMKILFSVSKKATKEDILKTIKIIEALRNNED